MANVKITGLGGGGLYFPGAMAAVKGGRNRALEDLPPQFNL